MKDLPPLVLALLNALVAVLTPFQIALLYIADGFWFLFFLVAGKKRRHRTVAIGVTETARVIHSLGSVFPDRYTTVLDKNPYYHDAHDFGPYPLWLRPFVGPVLLAYLARVVETFVYISFTGYLADRSADFRFLKRRHRHIVILFCGSDIRSLKKTKEYFDARGEDSFVNYLTNTNNEGYDRHVKRVARDADRYADLVFNWNIDQIGYLAEAGIPWPYVIDLEKHTYSFEQLGRGNVLRILHAPSHSAVKGTPLVRAAIKQLHEEGYPFEYIELINVSNARVLEELGKSHVVLQEFYCLVPGVFGIEALARGNAVLMSASYAQNPELPSDCEGAWLETPYWRVYTNLKNLLDEPARIEEYARRGRAFVERNYTYASAREFYEETFLEYRIPFLGTSGHDS